MWTIGNRSLCARPEVPELAYRYLCVDTRVSVLMSHPLCSTTRVPVLVCQHSRISPCVPALVYHHSRTGPCVSTLPFQPLYATVGLPSLAYRSLCLNKLLILLFCLPFFTISRPPVLVFLPSYYTPYPSLPTYSSFSSSLLVHTLPISISAS